MRICLLIPVVLRDYFALPMKLLMYFQNDLIDSVSIEYDKIVYPGYLSSFIRELRQKHTCALTGFYNEPEFLLHGNFIKSSSCKEKETMPNQVKRINAFH